MSNSISTDIQHLMDITEEIKRRRKELSDLRKSKQEYEERIIHYLETNNQPGIKYKGTTIIAEERKTRKPVKKLEKENRGTEILEKYGIDNGKETFHELMEALRGSPKPKSTLRIL